MASATTKLRRGANIADIVFDCFIYAIVIIVCFITLYPFYYIIVVSLSDTSAVMRGEVFWRPDGFNLSAYMAVLRYDGIVRAYINTIFYTVAGTAISLLLTALAAYPLSCRQ